VKHSTEFVRITYRPSNTVLAEGPLGWGITPFEGNFYVRRKYLKSGAFRVSFIPGLCVYKFLYIWLNLQLPSGDQERNIAWLYWFPNPLLPFIWYRVALPGNHPHLEVQLWHGEALATISSGNGTAGTTRRGK
jgi:uncharacterized protein (DUF427 family)